MPNSEFAESIYLFFFRASLLLPKIMDAFYIAEEFFPLRATALEQWVSKMQWELLDMMRGANSARNLWDEAATKRGACRIQSSFYYMYVDLEYSIFQLQRNWERGFISGYDPEEISEYVEAMKDLGEDLEKFVYLQPYKGKGVCR